MFDAGDPIELGAALSVCYDETNPPSKLGSAADAAASHAPLFLLAAKPMLGHSEPAAGLTNLIYAAYQAATASAVPVLHLRTINPHVASAIGSSLPSDASGFLGIPRMCMPLQCLSTASTPSPQQLEVTLGVSAFAFQVTRFLLQYATEGQPGVTASVMLQPASNPVECVRCAGACARCVSCKLC